MIGVALGIFGLLASVILFFVLNFVGKLSGWWETKHSVEASLQFVECTFDFVMLAAEWLSV